MQLEQCLTMLHSPYNLSHYATCYTIRNNRLYEWDKDDKLAEIACYTIRNNRLYEWDKDDKLAEIACYTIRNNRLYEWETTEKTR